MANLYFAEGLSSQEFTPGARIEVTGEEARHAVRVSRLRVGERILVGNGRGVQGLGTVEAAERDHFAVRLEEVSDVAAPTSRLVLVQALAKGDRDERAVEQATEFGADAILPWQADRSVSRWDGAGGSEKAAKGIAKWQRIAREAAKQSMRARIPGIGPVTTLRDLCDLAAAGEAHVVVLHPRGSGPLTGWAREALSRNDSPLDVYLVVGPEGGFSDREIDALEDAGAQIVLLGDTVLRTSSAGPAALAVLNVELGRW
ncbi:16S rRNA (uracil(1498)-N(3))-methyltransferase [Leucobacter sp. GX24907]